MPSEKNTSELAPLTSPAPKQRPEKPQAPTDAGVAAVATTHTGIEPGQTVLIGLIHHPAGARAMVRDPEGEIRTVVPGTHIGRAVVTAIGETALFLSENGEETVLSLPG